MFTGDLFRLDTLLLVLIGTAKGPVGTRDLCDALDELELDHRTHNIARELTKMHENGLVTTAGYVLRHGRWRTRCYSLTDTGERTLSQRRGLLNTILYDPPQVPHVEINDYPVQKAEGWQ